MKVDTNHLKSPVGAKGECACGTRIELEKGDEVDAAKEVASQTVFAVRCPTCGSQVVCFFGRYEWEIKPAPADKAGPPKKK